MKTRISLVLAGVALALSAAPAAQASQVTRCPGDQYAGIDPSGFPVVSNLRAINLPRKTYGYAPRCLVAESVAGMVQYQWNGKLPRTVHVQGARWDGGVWRMSMRTVYGDDYQYAVITARKGNQRVVFDGGS